MSVSRWIPIFLLYFLLAGCSSVRVMSDFDPDFDFSRVRTYGWEQVRHRDDALARHPLLYKRIVRMVDGYLGQHGLRRVDTGQADILLSIHGASREKTRVTTRPVPATGYYGRYYRYHPYPAYEHRVDVSTYTEGTLIIDGYDGSSGAMVWQGVGTGILGQYRDQDREDKMIFEYVSKILEQFPPVRMTAGQSGQ